MIIREPNTHLRGMTIGDPGNRGDGLEICADGVVVEDCIIHGGVRVWGEAKNGNEMKNGDDPNYVERVRLAAPSGVQVRRNKIIANGRIPVYLAPGVTYATIEDNELLGRSVSSGLYIDAECRKNVIARNAFKLVTGREMISIDAAEFNTVRENVFRLCWKGGVFIYRNCGEGGAPRYTQPIGNVIEDNVFDVGRRLFAFPAVWLNYRAPLRCILCYGLHRGNWAHGVTTKTKVRETEVGGNEYIGSALIWPKVVDWGSKSGVKK